MCWGAGGGGSGGRGGASKKNLRHDMRHDNPLRAACPFPRFTERNISGLV